ncbi:hypothetical protein AcidC75_12920 [Acidisoma sp. C75]
MQFRLAYARLDQPAEAEGIAAQRCVQPPGLIEKAAVLGRRTVSLGMLCHGGKHIEAAPGSEGAGEPGRGPPVQFLGKPRCRRSGQRPAWRLSPAGQGSVPRWAGSG